MMAEKGQITVAMLKHHEIINKLLLDFEKVPEEDASKFAKLFNAFMWNLHKHIFVEEQNIFPVSDKNNKIELKQLQNLLNDHRDIHKIVQDLNEEVLDDRKPKTHILRELLFAHEEREIESFYPLLDNRLPEEKKKDILRQIKDVKLG